MAKRIVATALGAPAAVRELVDVKVPQPGPGEVTIEVRAAGINPFGVGHVAGALGTEVSLLPLTLGQ